jgi:2-polyprenyl-3-methyl-5-hydroxy-6-metoxy-1,4-benzoquinol methylase
MPRPTSTELEKFYNTIYHENNPVPLNKQDARKRVRDLVKLIKTYNPSAHRILEIGTSYGYIIFGLRQWGYEVVGTDLASNACMYASKYYDLEVLNAEFPPEEMKGSFDVVVLSQVIEHTIDPLIFIQRTAEFLKKDGLIYIGTPNIGCLIFDILGKHYEAVRPPEHISFFNPQSMQELLARSGFRCIKIYTENPIWVEYNPVNHTFLSFLRLVGILQKVRGKVNPSSHNLLACKSGITKKNKVFKILRKTVDYVTRLISILFLPLLWMLGESGKGSILYCIGKKASSAESVGRFRLG